MSDFLPKVIAELIFRISVWLIERIGASSYVNDVVHGIQARLERRGPHAAAQSALGALPHAFVSRIAVGAQAVFGPGSARIGAVAHAVAPAITFSALFYSIFVLAPKLLTVVLALSLRAYPPPGAVTLSLIVVGCFILLSTHYARLICVLIVERNSVSLALLCVIASALSVHSLPPPFPGATLQQHIALNVVLPSLLAPIVAWIVFRIDDAVWTASRRGRYGAPAGGWAHYNTLTSPTKRFVIVGSQLRVVKRRDG